MTDQELERRKKLEELRSLGKDPFKVDHIKCTGKIEDYLNYSSKTEDELKHCENISVMGRIISMRQSFSTIRDGWNDLQLYMPNNGPKELLDYYNKYLDIGDVVFVRGHFFKTKLGKLTLRIVDLQITSKCINPFPDQYYGIKDEELKVRNRVARALVDRDFFNVIKLRSKLIFELRNYLNQLGYTEIETPILESVYGGANAIPFVTRYEALKQDFFLRIATEIPLKKAAIAGFSKVFEIGKVFRNEGIDSTHNPEFTSLEIYTSNLNLSEIMDLTEDIIKRLSLSLVVFEVVIDDTPIQFSDPFRRISMSDLVKERVDMDFYSGDVTLEDALQLAKDYEIELQPFEKTVGHIFQKVFDELVAPSIKEPTFVYGFHKDVSPLAKEDPVNKDFTLRYELYIGGMEFSNGFVELNDPDDQRKRFEKQQEERKEGNKEAFGIDEDFLFALQYGLPPTGGIGIGIDRLVMLFAQVSSIKEVIFFPQVKK